jgi:hypothetical protein
MLEKKKFYRMNNEQKGERFLIYERGLMFLPFINMALKEY